MGARGISGRRRKDKRRRGIKRVCEREGYKENGRRMKDEKDRRGMRRG